MSYKASGLEEIKLPEFSYGRRAWLYKYRGYILPKVILKDLRSLHVFDVREDDVWVVTFPKAGTTWVQEIVYLLMHNADTEKAATSTIDMRFPYFENYTPGLAYISTMQSPRLIKSHLPLSLLPNQMKEKKPKIIYVARNPKDTVVSFYSFEVKFLSVIPFNGTFHDYARLFATDKVMYGPWWKHVSEAWNRRDEDNILFLFYEDLHLKPAETVKQIGEFLGRQVSERQAADIVDHCSFKNMQNNSTTNYEWLKDVGAAKSQGQFMRKGTVGDWKNHLPPDIVKQLDDMVTSKLPDDIPIRDSLENKVVSRL